MFCSGAKWKRNTMAWWMQASGSWKTVDILECIWGDLYLNLFNIIFMANLPNTISFTTVINQFILGAVPTWNSFNVIRRVSVWKSAWVKIDKWFKWIYLVLNMKGNVYIKIRNIKRCWGRERCVCMCLCVLKRRLL